MAAHLHRYRSELSRLEDILDELAPSHDKAMPATNKEFDREGQNRSSTATRIHQSYEQIRSQFKAISGFHEELGRKIQNILALVCVSASPLSCVTY